MPTDSAGPTPSSAPTDRIDPWGSSVQAGRTLRATGATRCAPSRITGRADVFRCETPQQTLDPCFRKGETGDFLCSGANEWTLLSGVKLSKISRTGGRVTGTPITFVRLANGGWCSVWPDGPRSSGIPSYPVQVGHCSEGPYDPWAPWLGSAVQDAPDYPLENGRAVVLQDGVLTREPVTTVRR